MVRPRRVKAALVWVVAFFLPVAPAVAQQITGTVRDSTSLLAVAGAVVTAFGSTNSGVASVLTSERGEFRLVAPTGAGRLARLRIVRLGFRPVDVALPAGPDDVVRVDVVMLRIPYQLQEVRVAAAASCPRRPDRHASLALLEQARAGLLATVVARSDKVARMRRLSIERRLDARTNRVQRHRVTIDSISHGITAFGAARTATDFIKEGFASPDSTETGEGRLFYAPDADVLLDDNFAAGYCFHTMERDRARPHQVGLGFRAADRRRGRVDVDGALWIDTVARALVDLEFRYVRLESRLEEFAPGGWVAFREMANGVVLIDRWMLRLVGAEPDTGDDRAMGRNATARAPRNTPARFIVAEVGGELARAEWLDGSAWNASLGVLRLRLTSDRGAPVAGTLVRLDDTDYQAVSDSSGFLEIRDLAPGPYSASIVDGRLVPVGISLATELAFTAERGSIVERALVTKTAEHYVAHRCEALRSPHARPGTSVVDGTAWVIGVVVGPDGTPLADVKWTVSRAVSTDTEDLASGTTGTDGVFAFCRANRGDAIVVRFTRRSMGSGFVTRHLDTALTVIHPQMTPEKRR